MAEREREREREREGARVCLTFREYHGLSRQDDQLKQHRIHKYNGCMSGIMPMNFNSLISKRKQNV